MKVASRRVGVLPALGLGLPAPTSTPRSAGRRRRTGACSGHRPAAGLPVHVQTARCGSPRWHARPRLRRRLLAGLGARRRAQRPAGRIDVAHGGSALQVSIAYRSTSSTTSGGSPSSPTSAAALRPRLGGEHRRARSPRPRARPGRRSGLGRHVRMGRDPRRRPRARLLRPDPRPAETTDPGSTGRSSSSTSPGRTWTTSARRRSWQLVRLLDVERRAAVRVLARIAAASGARPAPATGRGGRARRRRPAACPTAVKAATARSTISGVVAPPRAGRGSGPRPSGTTGS